MSKYDFKNLEDFNSAKHEAEVFYNSIGEAYCAYFNQKILFNSKGWEHLLFRARRKSRTTADQYARFKLLPLVPKILGLSKTVQGIQYSKHFEKQRMSNRTDLVLVPVAYYEFIAVLESVRTKVIIKQVEFGNLVFWSVIPHWRFKSGLQNNRKLHEGDPEND